VDGGKKKRTWGKQITRKANCRFSKIRDLVPFPASLSQFCASWPPCPYLLVVTSERLWSAFSRKWNTGVSCDYADASVHVYPATTASATMGDSSCSHVQVDKMLSIRVSLLLRKPKLHLHHKCVTAQQFLPSTSRSLQWFVSIKISNECLKFIVPGPLHTITPTALSEQRSLLCNFLYSQFISSASFNLPHIWQPFGLAIWALHLAKKFPVPFRQGMRQGCTNPRLNFCTVCGTRFMTPFWRLEFWDASCIFWKSMDTSWVGRGVGLGAVKRQNFRKSEADHSSYRRVSTLTEPFRRFFKRNFMSCTRHQIPLRRSNKKCDRLGMWHKRRTQDFGRETRRNEITCNTHKQMSLKSVGKT
jgi:hypothetical protein